ncbi:enoyl-CoA hydratase [Aquibacillus sp. 3ASR75-11]|uniref:Enoyl-CoA hydratase n=1 Tax=Terrihalobacillus insolitus TaxID=2950438 RepID=A0A9X3WQH2_9BACI|nr:enoyl-CoA hydratase [Terrihalobacillus insolitus]MDC3412584.1 enoyl-CoA hydratase [Terrihalobacillus insolitus]MDC3423935.1 enoyl-CoA hydratase [Terrihalobacillus insolitus]
MNALNYEMSNHVATITLNSPPANALSSTIMQGLSDILDQIEKDPSIKAIVLKGEGKFFSAGADIKEFTTLQQSSDYQSLAKKGQDLFNRVENFHIPIIASIHGAALGGGLELAMACHIRIVTETAKLGLPELTLGIIPGFAGTQRLPQYVGTAKAYEMILLGEPITGKQAADWGLANTATSEDELAATTQLLAQKITEKSGPSIRHVMELIPYAKSAQFQIGVEKEAEAFGKIFGSKGAKEGIQAFIDKRKPNLKDI